MATAGRLPVTRAPTWPSPAEYTRTSYGEELADGQLTGQPAGIPLPHTRSEPLPPPQPHPTVNPYGYSGSGYDIGQAAATTPSTGPRGNVRQNPTAVGTMGLAPHETPMDRAVELTRRIEQLNGENVTLLVRIRQLEAAAEARETALKETLRDVQYATDEVSRTRVELQAARKELAAAKARLLQMEKDETETLKAIIAAVEKLLQQSAPPDGGKK